MKPSTKDSEFYDAEQWRTFQRMMSDSVKFVEQVHNIPWEDGIAPEIIASQFYAVNVSVKALFKRLH